MNETRNSLLRTFLVLAAVAACAHPSPLPTQQKWCDSMLKGRSAPGHCAEFWRCRRQCMDDAGDPPPSASVAPFCTTRCKEEIFGILLGPCEDRPTPDSPKDDGDL